MSIQKYKDSNGNWQIVGGTKLHIDSVLSSTSENPVQNKAVKQALDNKSTVSVSASGTSTEAIKYITIDGTEKKLGGGGVVVSGTEPTGDASMLWIDTANGGIAKYWNGSAWTTIKSVWG